MNVFDEEEDAGPPEKLKKAVQLMETLKFDEAETELKKGIAESESKGDKTMEALFHSSLGILYKLKKDYKTAWRHYEKAEKLMPEDPALKLVSARLLVDVFGQNDLAITKAKKVLQIAKDDWSFCHQAQATLGLAYLKKGDKKKAIVALTRAMEGDFEGMPSAASIDFKLLEALMRKNLGLQECYAYLSKALAFAKITGEEKQIHIFSQLLSVFPTDTPPAETPFS